MFVEVGNKPAVAYAAVVFVRFLTSVEAAPASDTPTLAPYTRCFALSTLSQFTFTASVQYANFCVPYTRLSAAASHKGVTTLVPRDFCILKTTSLPCFCVIVSDLPLLSMYVTRNLLIDEQASGVSPTAKGASCAAV